MEVDLGTIVTVVVGRSENVDVNTGAEPGAEVQEVDEAEVVDEAGVGDEGVTPTTVG